MNLARLGAQTVVVGITGGDEKRTLLAASLRSNGSTPHFIVSDGFPTITKTRILGGRQQMLRLDFERPGTTPSPNTTSLIEKALCSSARLSRPRALRLCQGRHHARGVPDADSRGPQARHSRCSWIPKSLDYSLLSRRHHHLPQPERAGRVPHGLIQAISTPSLLRPRRWSCDLDIEFLTATLSEKGIALVRPGNRFIAPAQARQVFDVSGAGDTVIAVLALCLASGLQPENAVQLANVAAGIVVGKVGTVPVEKHELLAALSPQIALHAEDRVLTRGELVQRVALWKANGERVVFTNGCFDLLHIGHITLLEQARRFGDRAHRRHQQRRIGEQPQGAELAPSSARPSAPVSWPPLPPSMRSSSSMNPRRWNSFVAVQPDVLVKGGDYDAETSWARRKFSPGAAR